MIAILTVAVALAKSGIVHRFRALLPMMNRIAAGLLLVAGAYVAYYGWYEIRVLDGATSDPIVDRAIRVQTWLQNTIVPDDPWRFALIAGGILAGTVLVSRLVRKRSQRGAAHDTPTDATLAPAADPQADDVSDVHCATTSPAGR